MPAEIPFHLQYELTRRQRLIPHLRIWLPGLPLVAASVLMFALVLFKWWLFPLGLLALWFCKGFWIGVVDVVANPVRKMDVIVQENGLGFLIRGQRWWIFLDGVTGVDRFCCSDTWTIRHCNGTVINIPVSAISEEQIQHIRDAAKKGHTPEGIHGVLERGRRLQEMKKERRRKKRGGEG